MKTITLALLMGLTGCGLTDPEESYVEVWSGIAIPLASDVASDADTTAADTTWVFAYHERDTLSNVVHATIVGECELAGPITDEGVWATLFRCGPSKRSSPCLPVRDSAAEPQHEIRSRRK